MCHKEADLYRGSNMCQVCYNIDQRNRRKGYIVDLIHPQICQAKDCGKVYGKSGANANHRSKYNLCPECYAKALVFAPRDDRKPNQIQYHSRIESEHRAIILELLHDTESARIFLDNYIIHHLNGNPLDNALTNMVLMYFGHHSSLHDDLRNKYYIDFSSKEVQLNEIERENYVTVFSRMWISENASEAIYATQLSSYAEKLDRTELYRMLFDHSCGYTSAELIEGEEYAPFTTIGTTPFDSFDEDGFATDF
jgi:hypothetical protein